MEDLTIVDPYTALLREYNRLLALEGLNVHIKEKHSNSWLIKLIIALVIIGIILVAVALLVIKVIL